MRTLVFLSLLICSSAAHATTAVQLSLPDLVRGADATVKGHAISQDSFWQGTRIYTLIHIAVDEVWASRSAVPKAVDLLTLGGRVGNIGQRVDGAAAVPTDRSVVLHLVRGLSGEYSAVAMAQGVWVISPTGTVDFPVSRPYVDRLVTSGNRPEPMPTTLSELKRAVQEAAHAQR